MCLCTMCKNVLVYYVQEYACVLCARVCLCTMCKSMLYDVKDLSRCYFLCNFAHLLKLILLNLTYFKSNFSKERESNLVNIVKVYNHSDSFIGNHYAPPSYGDAFSDRQLTLNFELK